MTPRSLRHCSFRFAVIVLVLVAINCAGPGADVPGQSLEGTDPPAAEILEGPHAEVTILTTNAADFIGQGEWSFAAWIEVSDRAILFDTGWSPENVLNNAKALGIDLSLAEDLILSHNHGDHTGGVETLRRELMKRNPQALSRIHVANGIFDSRPRPDGGEGNPMIAIKDSLESLGSEFIVYREPAEIAPGVWITGPVPRVHPEAFYPKGGQILNEEKELEPDIIKESQSAVILAAGGPIMISGCGHAGIRNTLAHTRLTVTEQPIQAAIGGFHLFASTKEELVPISDAMKAAGVGCFLGSHCTGFESVYQLREMTGMSRETARVGAIGTKFVSGVGIQAGAINR